MTSVLRLTEILSMWRDGDEVGWHNEFAYLRREHADRLDVLATSIQETGMHTPVLLGDDGRVWDGHHRLCVATTIGLEFIPVEFADKRPGYCCGRCPPIVGGGYDCTCRGNPRCRGQVDTERG